MIGKRSIWRGAAAGIAGLALVVSGPAQAACFDEATLNAARVHEFATLMMDMSLRCNRIGVVMQAHYEKMLVANHVQFEAAAHMLQHYFALDPVSETRHGGAFDSYATLVANHYGGGKTTLDTCRLSDTLANEIALAADDGRMLGAVAMMMVEHPVLEHTPCAVKR